MTDAWMLFPGQSFPTSCYTIGEDLGESDKGNVWFFNDTHKCYIPYNFMAEDVAGLPRCDSGCSGNGPMC
jgi:hypothetical protein